MHGFQRTFSLAPRLFTLSMIQKRIVKPAVRALNIYSIFKTVPPNLGGTNHLVFIRPARIIQTCHMHIFLKTTIKISDVSQWLVPIKHMRCNAEEKPQTKFSLMTRIIL